MRNLLDPILTRYSNRLHQWQATALYTAVLFYAATRLPLLWPDALDRAAEHIGLDPTPLALIHVVLLGLAGLAFWLTRRGSRLQGTGMMVVVLLAEGTLYLVADAWNTPRGWAELWMGILLAGLLLDRRHSAAATGFGLVVLVISAFHNIGDLNTAAQNEQAALFFMTALWTAALGTFTTVIMAGYRQTLATAQAQDRTQHLFEIGQELTRHLFARAELDEFLEHIALALRKRFEFVDHVEIYLIEPGSQEATLRAATGPAGERMLAQEHALHIGGLSVVGRVTLTGRSLLITDSIHDPIHKPPPLLPETRSELAIPLTIHEDIIGAIDLQSTRVNAFIDEQISLLEAITNQIAIAVDSLRLYEAAQRSTRENQALYQQAQASLREIKRLNYQLTGHAWTDYLHTQPDATAITLDLKTRQISPDAEWTPTLNEAATHHQVITTTADGRRVVALPIIVRNEAIGAMEFELDKADTLPDGALELVRAVSQRLGLAMENRRLFDETQRVAHRETLINDIGADLQSATGVDAIIQRAAQQLQQALSTQQVSIRLHMNDREEDV